MKEEYIQFENESGDKKYFAIIPYLITNGYNARIIGVYTYIKRRCGENKDGIWYEIKTEAAKKLGMNVNTFLNILQTLKKDKRIEKIGRKVFKTSPIDIYKITDIWKENILSFQRESENKQSSLKRESENNTLRESENNTSKKKPIKEYNIVVASPQPRSPTFLKELSSLSRKNQVKWDFVRELEKMSQNKRRDLQLIAFYWQFKGIKFENKKQFQAGLKREIRPVQNLIGYSNERIKEVMEWLSWDSTVKWTVETIHKYIDENLNELKHLEFRG